MDARVKNIKTDVLIVGSGLAGLRAAIEARRYKVGVLLIDKSIIGLNTNSRFSGGGFKAALPKVHVDTYTRIFKTPWEHMVHSVRYGEYLNNQRLVEILCFEAPSRIMELEDFGVEHFGEMQYHFAWPHGTGLIQPLIECIERMGVRTLKCNMVLDLVVGGHEIEGAISFDFLTNTLNVISAKSVVLATGGAGEIYERNDTTKNTTGDGFALGYKAGCELVDMEMVQFEPYVQAEPGLPMMDRHECEAEFYGVLRNSLGEDFLPKYVPVLGSYQERHFMKRFGAHLTDIREIVSRAMCIEVHEGRGCQGSVLFDLTDVEDEKWEADPASKYTRRVLLRGFDVKRKPVHVFPGAIHNMGGIRICESCVTKLKGLYAAGEVAGGVQGAARLGGNALSECLVFGAVAGRNAAQNSLSSTSSQIGERPVREIRHQISEFLDRKRGIAPEDIQRRIKSTMWNNVGVLREANGLEEALSVLNQLGEDIQNVYVAKRRKLKVVYETQNMLETAKMVTKSALMRAESRGAHYRLDATARNDREWLANIVISKGKKDMKLCKTRPEITIVFPEPQSLHNLEVIS